MKKIYAVLLLTFFLISLLAEQQKGVDNSSINFSITLQENSELLRLIQVKDSLTTGERLDLCKQAKRMAVSQNNNDLILKILLLQAEIYKETQDVEKYTDVIHEYLQLYTLKNELEIEKTRKQISKQIFIRNSFMIGFLIILNLAFVFFVRYKLRSADQNKLKKANEKLKELSSKDPLTGLSNRRDCLEKINYEIVRSNRNNRIFSIIMSDIDHFKSVNDNYGHNCGDYILQELAKILTKTLRKQDIVSRWGGEEFLLLLPETNLEGAKFAAEKIRTTIEKNKFFYDKKAISITLTFGISEFAKDKTVDTCVREADTALYKGKHRGRNRIELFKDSDILIG
ncbi:MAG: GGDEF domain-containing protein [Candidatus Cloacimonetes bacterium]|nr:GGDEF domain-containing protein [Candidatus Cloacimonadota bacterium]